MATDRAILKSQQVGALKGTAALYPDTEIGKAHEETFIVSNVAGSPLAEVAVVGLKKAARVKSIVAVPNSTLATAASNYITGTVYKRDGAGGSAVSIGAFTTNSTGGAALTAFQQTTVSLTASAVDLASGNVLTFALVDNAATTEPQVSVAITVEYI